uniref:ribonuclease T2 n=1 Tax=Mycena chlorophos TaxID=658473 RepID=A0ABQ0LX91_MYCCL|nr:RNase Gf29 [Mycena chlorophos]
MDIAQGAYSSNERRTCALFLPLASRILLLSLTHSESQLAMTPYRGWLSVKLTAAVVLVLAHLAHAQNDKQKPLAAATGGTDCPADSPLSCSANAADEAGSCCLESPGGLLLQTQFWDTDPATGPSDSWTIHGLWPDDCDLKYQEKCDPSRAYTDIGGLLSAQGAQSTLDYMQTYWVDINGKDETFWEHEWATHGTCYATLNPSCLPAGSPQGAEAVAFFTDVVNLFQTLPTYTWLANAGITPSDSKTYTLEELTSALQSRAGVKPTLDCESDTLDSVAYYFNLRGSLLADSPGFVAIDAPEDGTCPQTGIKYPPKSEAGGGDGDRETPSRHKRRHHKKEGNDERKRHEEL